MKIVGKRSWTADNEGLEHYTYDQSTSGATGITTFSTFRKFSSKWPVSSIIFTCKIMFQIEYLRDLNAVPILGTQDFKNLNERRGEWMTDTGSLWAIWDFFSVLHQKEQSIHFLMFSLSFHIASINKFESFHIISISNTSILPIQ